MINEMKKVTVIVPVYNGESYIKRCLDSLMNQTVDYYKIIVVNDGSTDGTRRILEGYQRESKVDFKIIDQKNGGASSARNNAIKNVDTEYILFVDSDDYVSQDYVKLLYQAVSKENADMACCRSVWIEKNKRTIHGVNKNITILVNETPNVIYELLTIFWDKIFRTSLFQKGRIKLPEGIMFEDLATVPRLVAHCKKISFISDCLYYYDIREGSVMSHAMERIDDYYKVLKTINLDDMRFQYQEQYDYLIYSIICNYIGNVIQQDFNYDRAKKGYRYLRKHVRWPINKNPCYKIEIKKSNLNGRLVNFCVQNRLWMIIKAISIISKYRGEKKCL